MAITLIDAAAGNPVSSADYNANNTAIENALTSLDGGDIQAASIPNTALANSEAFSYLTGRTTTTGSQDIYIPIWATADVQIRGYRWHITDAGTGNGSIIVTHGTVTSGSYVSAGTIVVGASIPTTGVDGDDRVGGASAFATVPSTSTVIRVEFTAGTGQNSNSGDAFSITFQALTALAT